MMATEERELTEGAPHAWIGCLACYNAGTLRGFWADGIVAGDVTPEELHGRPTSHEELWVFDFENYAGALSGECSPSEAQRIAEELEQLEELAGTYRDDDELRHAWGAYVGYVGRQNASLDSFQDAYVGTFDAFEDYAYELGEDVLEIGAWSDTARTYFDWKAWARDLILGGDCWTADAPGYRVHVFHGC